MNIYLIGVSHDFQIKPHALFEEYVLNACTQYGIMSIGEEMCQDALDEAGVTTSIIKMVAEKIGLPQAYCGPGRKDREAFKISGELLLEAQKIHYEWTDEKFKKEVLKDRKKREAIWLERIKSLFQDPMLFVCGIDHLNTFGSLLSANGYVCRVLEKKWDSRLKE